jgi:hypothetical protein
MDNDKRINILLNTINMYWNQSIQNENQRAAFTNYLIILIGALQGYIIQRQFDKFSILLSVLMIILGVFGALITAKYYERFRDQISRANILMEKLKEIEPTIDLNELEYKARQRHKKNFPYLIKIRLNWLWLFFYFLLIGMGVFNFFVILFGLP